VAASVGCGPITPREGYHKETQIETIRHLSPGAPDGEYVVIQFETSFEKKKSSIETITPIKEKDGSWRVSGYYIK
jgi:hypothetical protein